MDRRATRNAKNHGQVTQTVPTFCGVWNTGRDSPRVSTCHKWGPTNVALHLASLQTNPKKLKRQAEKQTRAQVLLCVSIRICGDPAPSGLHCQPFSHAEMAAAKATESVPFTSSTACSHLARQMDGELPTGLWGMESTSVIQKGLPKDDFLHKGDSLVSQKWGETP